MTTPDYPVEELHPDADDGTMPKSVANLADAVVGHRIVSVVKENPEADDRWDNYGLETVITLDNGKQVRLRNTGDCCAYTELQDFLLDPNSVDHIILGVGTTDEYQTWHVYADFGDIMKMKVGWSGGNVGYYGYGFDIEVVDNV